MRKIQSPRWWLSWYQPGSDHRPMTYPPNKSVLGWWCTGYSEESDTLCALVQAPSEESAWRAVLKDWPDMIDRRFIEEKDQNYTINNDRFPLSEWMIPRMKPQSENIVQPKTTQEDTRAEGTVQE